MALYQILMVQAETPQQASEGVMWGNRPSFRLLWTESEVAQSCQTLSDPMNCGPPGSSIQGIFQARVLEWGAIAFSFD